MIKEEAPKKIHNSRYGWTIIVFLIFLAVIAGMLIWQLTETAPGSWCQLADESSEGMRTACLQAILQLIPVKDHAIIGLLSILGISVIALAAVALGVKISAQGPGGTSVGVGREETRVPLAEADVVVPNESQSQ